MTEPIPASEVELAEQAIKDTIKKLETARGGDKVFYELVLKGWIRRLSFAREEEKKDKQHSINNAD